MGRSYGNNWHDAMMAEIELGSREAYIAMAWEDRFSDRFNRSYDHGITGMELWHIFRIDELCEDGVAYEEAISVAQDTPWGPYEWTDEMLDEDEQLVRERVAADEERQLDELLRCRP